MDCPLSAKRKKEKSNISACSANKVRVNGQNKRALADNVYRPSHGPVIINTEAWFERRQQEANRRPVNSSGKPATHFGQAINDVRQNWTRKKEESSLQQNRQQKYWPLQCMQMKESRQTQTLANLSCLLSWGCYQNEKCWPEN